MQVGPKKTKRTFKTAKPYKKKQRTDSNALQVCTVKGSCPVPDVYNCQFTYGGYDPISMSSIGNYTGQYIYAANSLYDPLQSGGGNQPYYYDQLVAPSSGDSGLFKAWKVSASRSSLSSVLQAQIQSRSIAGFSRSPVTTQLSQLSLQTSMSTPRQAMYSHPRWWIPNGSENEQLSSHLHP